jgi:hypothetical protein
MYVLIHTPVEGLKCGDVVNLAVDLNELFVFKGVGKSAYGAGLKAWDLAHPEVCVINFISFAADFDLIKGPPPPSKSISVAWHAGKECPFGFKKRGGLNSCWVHLQKIKKDVKVKKKVMIIKRSKLWRHGYFAHPKAI